MKSQPEFKEDAANATEQGPFTLGLQLLNGGKTGGSFFPKKRAVQCCTFQR